MRFLSTRRYVKGIALSKRTVDKILLSYYSIGWRIQMKRIYFERIAVDPEIMVGKPVFKGTRIPVYIVLDLLGDGVSEDEVIKIYPDLSREDIMASIKFASLVMNRQEFYETA